MTGYPARPVAVIYPKDGDVKDGDVADVDLCALRLQYRALFGELIACAPSARGPIHMALAHVLIELNIELNDVSTAAVHGLQALGLAANDDELFAACRELAQRLQYAGRWLDVQVFLEHVETATAQRNRPPRRVEYTPKSWGML